MTNINTLAGKLQRQAEELQRVQENSVSLPTKTVVDYDATLAMLEKGPIIVQGGEEVFPELKAIYVWINRRGRKASIKTHEILGTVVGYTMSLKESK